MNRGAIQHDARAEPSETWPASRARAIARRKVPTRTAAAKWIPSGTWNQSAIMFSTIVCAASADTLTSRPSPRRETRRCPRAHPPDPWGGRCARSAETSETGAAPVRSPGALVQAREANHGPQAGGSPRSRPRTPRSPAHAAKPRQPPAKISAQPRARSARSWPPPATSRARQIAQAGQPAPQRREGEKNAGGARRCLLRQAGNFGVLAEKPQHRTGDCQ